MTTLPTGPGLLEAVLNLSRYHREHENTTPGRRSRTRSRCTGPRAR